MGVGVGSGSGIGKVEGSTSSTGGVGGKEGKGVGQWRELCGLWSGIRNLKLTIKGGLVIDTRSSGSSEHISGRLSVLNTNCEWVSHGLMALTSLRTLELEIEDTDVPSESKMAFCAALERCLVTKDRKAMGADDWVGDTRVIFMEKTRVVQDTKKDKFVYYANQTMKSNDWIGHSGLGGQFLAINLKTGVVASYFSVIDTASGTDENYKRDVVIVEIDDDIFISDVVNETLNVSNLQELNINDSVNLERCMRIDGRINGHLVQGHIDQVGKCVKIIGERPRTPINLNIRPER